MRKLQSQGVAAPLEAYREHFLGDGEFVGGAGSPTIADIRLAATLEFLGAIDYELPSWAEEHKEAVESALGDAYSEAAAEVRGFVESVK